MVFWAERDEAYYKRLHNKYHNAYTYLVDSARKALEVDHQLETAMGYAEVMTRLHRDIDTLRTNRRSLVRHLHGLHRIRVSKEQRHSIQQQREKAVRDIKVVDKQLREKYAKLHSIKKVTRRDVWKKISEYKEKIRKARPVLR